MKVKFFTAPAIIVVLLIASILSCRKIDNLSETPTQIKLVKERFFDEHRSGDPIEQKLIQFLKSKNDSFHFVEKTVTQIGYPRWDKAIVLNKPAANKKGEEESNHTADIIYIPFVRDSQNYVNASLIFKIDGSDTAFRYLCDWQCAQFGNDSTQGKWSSKTVFHFFLQMDNRVFGHERFLIKDSALISTDLLQQLHENNISLDSVAVFISIKGGKSQRMMRLSSDAIYVCTDYVECTENPKRAFRKPNAQLSKSTASTSNCISYRICETFGSDDSGGGGSGGDTDSGGSGGTGGGKRRQQWRITHTNGM